MSASGSGARVRLGMVGLGAGLIGLVVGAGLGRASAPEPAPAPDAIASSVPQPRSAPAEAPQPSAPQADAPQRWEETVPPAPPQGGLVYPRAISDLPPVNLPDLVFAAMAPKGANPLRWDHMTGARVRWLTDGYETREDGLSHRHGLARVRFGGRKSTVLRQSPEELAWTVTLSTSDMAKFGPTAIELSPGAGERPCFGDLYDGCDFDVATVLAGPFRSRRICRQGGEANYVDIYWLTAPGKEPARLSFSMTCGSGGCSNGIEIDPRPADQRCGDDS